MKSVLFIAMLGLVACGKPKKIESDSRQFKTVDPAFNSYVSFYEQMKGDEMSSIGIGFEKLEWPKVGVCVEWTNGKKEIKIDPDYWQLANETRRISLFFHELGHCDLGRGHLNTLVDGKPISIMNYYVVEWYSQGEEELYFDELFNY